MAPWKEQFVHDLDSGGECRVPWCVSTSDNGLDHVNFDNSELKTVWQRFSPEYPARVNDVSDGELEANVRGTFSNMADIPDTDAEHELAAGVYPDSEQMNEVEKRQLVLVLPFRNVPNTNACRYIFGDEIQPSRLGEWAALFVKKQTDYGNGADDLGEAGQYAELHRKITKLRRAMWEGHELVGEPLREVLMDLIGHCFLAMMYVDQPRHTRYPKGNPNK